MEAQARWDPVSRHTRSTRRACADPIWNSSGAQHWAISRRSPVLPARFPRNQFYFQSKNVLHCLYAAQGDPSYSCRPSKSIKSIPPIRATYIYSRLSYQGTPKTLERAPTLLANRLQYLREENQRLKDKVEIQYLEEENNLLRQDPLNLTLL